MNIKDVEFDFRMGCILVLFPFLWIINVQFTNFEFLKFWFSNIVILAYFDPNYYFYHWNFSKATFIYKILYEITLTHTGWAWKIQNVIFCHFWELKNSSHNKHSNTLQSLLLPQFSTYRHRTGFIVKRKQVHIPNYLRIPINL